MDALQHAVQALRGENLLETSRLERVEADVEPLQAGVLERLRLLGQQDAVGRQRDIVESRQSRPAARRARGRSCRTSGSPPVSRSLLTPKPAATRTNRSISSNVRISTSRHETHVLGRHAVEAADIAAIGDADPQVRVHAAEAIDERHQYSGCRVQGTRMTLHRMSQMRASRQLSFGIRRLLSGMHPFAGAVGPVFAFPDRHDFFERVDQPLSRLEGRLSMGRADGDGHAGLADSTRPSRWTIAHSTIGQRLASLGLQLGQLSFGHFGIALVIERRRRRPSVTSRVVPRNSTTAPAAGDCTRPAEAVIACVRSGSSVNDLGDQVAIPSPAASDRRI